VRRLLALSVLMVIAVQATACVGDNGGGNEPRPPSNCETNPVGPSCRPTPPAPEMRRLGMVPIAQQTPVWCWAATAEMVFRHFGLPSVNGFGNYQCGIVAAYFGGACATNCGLCVSPIASMFELNRVLVQYGVVARQLGLTSPLLATRLLFRSLSMTEIREEIDNNRPIVAGITAGGFPFPNIAQHVTVIVGYETSAAGTFLFVNDPFPYNLPQFVGNGNPYFAFGATEVQPGQYKIAYDTFVGRMAWGNSIDRITRQ
jgi:hypothetical protein